VSGTAGSWSSVQSVGGEYIGGRGNVVTGQEREV
jgi:hypothetical protein